MAPNRVVHRIALRGRPQPAAREGGVPPAGGRLGARRLEGDPRRRSSIARSPSTTRSTRAVGGILERSSDHRPVRRPRPAHLQPPPRRTGRRRRRIPPRTPRSTSAPARWTATLGRRWSTGSWPILRVRLPGPASGRARERQVPRRQLSALGARALSRTGGARWPSSSRSSSWTSGPGSPTQAHAAAIGGALVHGLQACRAGCWSRGTACRCTGRELEGPAGDHRPRSSSRTCARRLARNKRVRRTLPGWGRLHIDRQLPFLCVYRRPPAGPTRARSGWSRARPSYLDRLAGSADLQPGLPAWLESDGGDDRRDSSAPSWSSSSWSCAEARGRGHDDSRSGIPRSVSPAGERHRTAWWTRSRAALGAGARLRRAAQAEVGRSTRRGRAARHAAAPRPGRSRNSWAASLLGLEIRPIYREPDDRRALSR